MLRKIMLHVPLNRIIFLVFSDMDLKIFKPLYTLSYLSLIICELIMIKIIQSIYRKRKRLVLFPFLFLIILFQASSISYVDADSHYTGLQATSINKDLVLDPWGNLFYYLTYDISNIAGLTKYIFNLQLPTEAEDVTVYDHIGTLYYDLSEGESVKNLTVLLRYPLRGTIDNIVFNDSCSFTVKYRVNVQNIVTQMDSWNNFMLKTNVSNSLNWTIETYAVTITLPEGAKSLQTTPSNADISQNLFTQSITFSFQNLTSVIDFDLFVEYEYAFFWSIFRPALWIGIPVLILVGVIIIRKRRKPYSSVVISKNVEILQSFVKTYERRLRLRSEMDSLEASFENKRIRKKDYNRRKRILEQRIRMLNKAIKKLANGVRLEGSKYKNFIERIERSEKEITSVNGEINHLRTQFRSKQISRNKYRDSQRKYNQKIERATADIEGIINKLREEAK